VCNLLLLKVEAAEKRLGVGRSVAWRFGVYCPPPSASHLTGRPNRRETSSTTEYSGLAPTDLAASRPDVGAFCCVE
jgi:hypothetical protein